MDLCLSLFLTVFPCTFFCSPTSFVREAARLGVCQDPRRPPSAKPTASHPSPPFVEAWLRISRFCLSFGNFFVLLYCLTEYAAAYAYVVCVLFCCPSVRPMSRWGFFGVQIGCHSLPSVVFLPALTWARGAD